VNFILEAVRTSLIRNLEICLQKYRKRTLEGFSKGAVTIQAMVRIFEPKEYLLGWELKDFWE
jgi:hypothetical protein